jgi:hypothetical protein
LGLKTAKDLDKKGKLFRAVLPEVTASDIIPVKKNGHAVFEPTFTRIHPSNVKRSYDAFKRKGKSLYQIRDGKIRTFRSPAYQRQAHARLLNLKLRPFALQRQRLERKVAYLSKDFKINEFSDVSEIHTHIPVLKALIDFSLELVKVDIRMAEKKLDYYDRFPSRQSRSIVANIEKGLLNLERKEDNLTRKKKALQGIEGDLRLFVTQAKVRQKLSVELTNQLSIENSASENPTGEQLSNVLKLTHLRERFHKARVNLFEVEMKLYHLYGILFSGRTEAAIRNDIIAAQEKVNEAIIKRRRLTRDE